MQIVGFPMGRLKFQCKVNLSFVVFIAFLLLIKPVIRKPGFGICENQATEWQCLSNIFVSATNKVSEPHHEKTGLLPM